MNPIEDPELLAQLNGTAKPAAKPNATKGVLEGLSDSLKTFRDTTKAAQHGFANAVTLGAYDKYASPDPLTKEEEAAHPLAHAAGAVAGTVAPATGISKALQGIRGLGGTGILSNAANQALTSGAMSAGEHAVQGETPAVGDTLFSMLLGGGLGGLGAGIGKMSSGVRIADASKGIDDATKQGMKGIIDISEKHGVKMSIPQAAEAVAPGGEAATALDSLYAASKSAAQDTNNAFAVAQRNAMPNAVESIKDEARTAAAPFYKQTENILFPGMPTSGSTTHSLPTKNAFAETVSKLQNDPVTGSMFRGRAAHSGMVADAARKEMQGMGESMFEKHPLKSALYRDAAQDVYKTLKQNPHYARADETWRTGMDNADKIKEAVSSGMTKTGGESGAHGLLGMMVQHPFVVGGAVGGLEGARRDGIEGGISGGLLGLGAATAFKHGNDRARRRVVEKLLDSGYLDQLGKHPKVLDAINAISQGLQFQSR